MHLREAYDVLAEAGLWAKIAIGIPGLTLGSVRQATKSLLASKVAPTRSIRLKNQILGPGTLLLRKPKAVGISRTMKTPQSTGELLGTKPFGKGAAAGGIVASTRKLLQGSKLPGRLKPSLIKPIKPIPPMKPLTQLVAKSLKVSSDPVDVFWQEYLQTVA